MKSCPHGIAAWKCKNYIHYIYSGTMCLDKKRAKLNNKEDEIYCGYCEVDCKGYEIDKRFDIRSEL